MLPHYSPFKVAETFKLLAALAPDRIDLGLGRAPGTDGRTSYALQRDRSRRMPVDDFPQNLAEVLAYLGNGLPEDHPFASLKDTLPTGGGTVEPWLLGSSIESAAWAAEVGLPYCIADFINSDGLPQAELYKRHFRPSRWLDKPYLMVASWAIAAPSRAEAERLAVPARPRGGRPAGAREHHHGATHTRARRARNGVRPCARGGRARLGRAQGALLCSACPAGARRSC